MTESLLVGFENGVLTLTLNRPQVHNALDDECLDGLRLALDRAEQDKAVRMLVLKASGPTFCSGVDLTRMRRLAELSQEEKIADAVLLTSTFARVAYLPKPTVVAVQGPAYGGGVGLAVACDIMIAADTARFTLSEVRHGLLPGFVAPLLAAAIGTRQARRFLVTGRAIGAEEARQVGLVHELVPAAELDAALQRTIDEIVAGGPASIAATKHILASPDYGKLEGPVLRRIAEDLAAHRSSPEAVEGMAAFREKRKPVWPT